MGMCRAIFIPDIFTPWWDFVMVGIYRQAIIMILRKGRDRLSEMGDFLYKVPFSLFSILYHDTIGIILFYVMIQLELYFKFLRSHCYHPRFDFRLWSLSLSRRGEAPLLLWVYSYRYIIMISYHDDHFEESPLLLWVIMLMIIFYHRRQYHSDENLPYSSESAWKLRFMVIMGGKL